MTLRVRAEAETTAIQLPTEDSLDQLSQNEVDLRERGTGNV